MTTDNNLKHILEQLGLTTRQFANACDMSYQHAYYYMTTSKKPSIDVALKFHDYFKRRGLNITLDEIYNLTPVDENKIRLYLDAQLFG